MSNITSEQQARIQEVMEAHTKSMSEMAKHGSLTFEQLQAGLEAQNRAIQAIIEEGK